MSKEKIRGIYCIENLVNEKRYIGQSCDIYARWYNHKYCLNNKIHSNSYLQKAWDKYGQENFKFEILEICDEELIDDKEVYYINLYNTLNEMYGYNLDSGGNKNKHHNELTRQKISNAHIGKTLSLETRKKISKNRKGKMCGKAHFFYGQKLPQWRIDILTSYARLRCGELAVNSKKIICINTKEVFNTIREAEEKYKQFGCNNQNLTKCCKGQRRYCGKFEDGTPIQWAYYYPDIEYSLKDDVDKYIGNSKPVIQFDKSGKIVRIYESAREAERITGIGYKMISKVCNGVQNYTYGYHFEFANNMEDKTKVITLN